MNKQQAFYINQNLNDLSERSQNDPIAYRVTCRECTGVGSLDHGTRLCAQCQGKGYEMVLNESTNKEFQGYKNQTIKEPEKTGHMATKKISLKSGKTLVMKFVSSGCPIGY